MDCRWKKNSSLSPIMRRDDTSPLSKQGKCVYSDIFRIKDRRLFCCMYKICLNRLDSLFPCLRNFFFSTSNNFVPWRLFFFINNIDELNNSRGGSRIWRKKGRNRWSDMRNLLTVIRFSGSETVKTKDLRAIDLRVIARPCRWLARGRG